MSELIGAGQEFISPLVGMPPDGYEWSTIDATTAEGTEPRTDAYTQLEGGVESTSGALYARNSDSSYTMVRMSKWD